MIFRKLKDFFGHISIECLLTSIYFLCEPFTVVITPFGSLLKVFTMPIVAVLSYRLFFGKKKNFAFNSVHFVYALYMVYTLVSLLFLTTNVSTIMIKDMMLAFFVMLLITMHIYNDYERELMEDAWLIVGIVCVYLCLTSSKPANEFESRTVVYILGFPEDPNQFCAYFIMPVMVCVRRIVERRKLLLGYMILVLLTFYAILKTGSRGGLIGIVLGIACYVIIGIKSIKTKIGFLVLGIIGALFVVTVVFPMLPEDVQERYSVEKVEEDKGSGRFIIWQYLVNYTAENPARLIHGSGINSTQGILEKAREVEHVGVAHNQFIQVLTDQGILGILLFAILILTCVFRNYKKGTLYSCAFIAVMAFSMSLTFYSFKPYINIIMMCAMNFNLVQSKNSYREGAKNEITFKSHKKIKKRITEN